MPQCFLSGALKCQWQDLQQKILTHLLLPSYSAVLQFNQYKDIEYPSFLFRVYKNSTNTFDESSVSFDDPLLGSFQANFL